jgi:hypothetical protein
MDANLVGEGVKRLAVLARNGDETALREALAVLVPEGSFCPQRGEERQAVPVAFERTMEPVS